MSACDVLTCLSQVVITFENLSTDSSFQNLTLILIVVVIIIIEPQHDKTNKMTVLPAKTQISLGICPD